jgi:hypothetical protein
MWAFPGQPLIRDQPPCQPQLRVRRQDHPRPAIHLLGGSDPCAVPAQPRSSKEARTRANAVVARVSSTFWLQTTQGSAQPDLLQYRQPVLLNFNGISWPHVSVATLCPATTPLRTANSLAIRPFPYNWKPSGPSLI